MLRDKPAADQLIDMPLQCPEGYAGTRTQLRELQLARCQHEEDPNAALVRQCRKDMDRLGKVFLWPTEIIKYRLQKTIRPNQEVVGISSGALSFQESAKLQEL